LLFVFITSGHLLAASITINKIELSKGAVKLIEVGFLGVSHICIGAFTGYL